MSTCRSCGAPIVWARRPVPLDANPVADGEIVFASLGVVDVLKAGETTLEPRYRSHFATCPHANQWRRRP